MKKIPKAQNNKRIYIAIIPIFLFTIYVLLDYSNVPQLIGLSISRINMEIFNIFLNSVIVLSLYICTYFFVDRRQIKKDINAKNTAHVLLLHTYKECLDNLSIAENTETVKKYIIPNIDGTKPLEDNKAVSILQNSPFASQDEILELSKGGYVEKETLNKYLHIQREHKFVISMKIVFYDRFMSQSLDQKTASGMISRRSNELLELLREEINRLEAIT